jgi:hypothetical protein
LLPCCIAALLPCCLAALLPCCLAAAGYDINMSNSISAEQSAISQKTDLLDVAEEKRREHKRFSENHYGRSQTLAAWLLGTLVAINTSGAAAVIAAVKDADRQPAIAFATGIVLAVVSGICSWTEAHGRAGYHYVESLQAPDQMAMRTKRVAEWQMKSFELLSPVLNVLSLLAFVVGCFWAAQVL